MSTVNIAECLTALQRVGVGTEEGLNLIIDVITTILPFDLEQAELVAVLQQFVKHKSLSLGDRACIALGMKLQAPIYTADKIWTDLHLNNADIRLIR